jgi:hypothetical protein
MKIAAYFTHFFHYTFILEENFEKNYFLRKEDATFAPLFEASKANERFT